MPPEIIGNSHTVDYASRHYGNADSATSDAHSYSERDSGSSGNSNQKKEGHYTRFWKQSTLLCDGRWPDFMNMYAPGKVGSAGVAEPKFLNAVTVKKGPTGEDFTFLEGIPHRRRW